MRFMFPSHASWVFIGRLCSWWHVVRFFSIYRMYCVRANRLALSSNVRGHLEFYRKFISFITIFHYLALSALRSSFHLLRFLVRHILSFTNRSQNRKRDDEGEEKSWCCDSIYNLDGTQFMLRVQQTKCQFNANVAHSNMFKLSNIQSIQTNTATLQHFLFSSDKFCTVFYSAAHKARKSDRHTHTERQCM